MKSYKLLVFDWEGTLASRDALFPEVLETLKKLQQNGYLLAIATSKFRTSLQKKLHEYEIEGLFAATSCSDDGHFKPDPQMLWSILDELNIDGENTVMIGDSETDLQLAENAEVDVILVDRDEAYSHIADDYNVMASVKDIAGLQQLFLFDS